jgi:hypothetical protein
MTSLVGCGVSTPLLTIIDAEDQQSIKVGWRDYQDWVDAEIPDQGIPFERVLYSNGFQVIDQVEFLLQDGNQRNEQWLDIAEKTYWLSDGSISLNGETILPSQVIVRESDLIKEADFSITDLAPAILEALDLPLAEGMKIAKLHFPKTQHVIFIFLDAFGFTIYQEALDRVELPYISTLSEPMLGITVYPPVTRVATASILSGLTPQENGVVSREVRGTQARTIFDIFEEEGRSYDIIEGNTLYLNNLSAETLHLTADANENGSTDDEIFTQVMRTIQTDLPDFLWVHYHGIDDAGHTYGLWSDEYNRTLQEIDGMLQRMVEASPPGTVIMITADHGMHPGSGEGRLGDHGLLVAEDMFIPLFSLYRQ